MAVGIRLRLGQLVSADVRKSIIWEDYQKELHLRSYHFAKSCLFIQTLQTIDNKF